MKSLKNIAILPGDGIGPEVVAQAVKVMDAIKIRFNLDYNYHFAEFGAAAIDKTGDPFPEKTKRICEASDAIVLGAIGDPKYDQDPNAKVRPEQGLLKLRKELGLYANIRPIKVYENLAGLSVIKATVIKDCDFIIYRELTGGIYFGDKTNGKDFATDNCRYERYEIERIAKKAFEAAEQRKGKLCLVDKANVLATSRLWRKIVQEMSESYPTVKVNFLYIDNAAMQIILNPNQFDIILCSNMFGDILSDEASVIVGSLGLLPSASVGKTTSLYEPCHGSYPEAAGTDIANPMATILSVEMMFRDFGMMDEAEAIAMAIDYCMENSIMTTDLQPEIIYSCSQMGDVLETLILEKNQSLNIQRITETKSTIL